MTLAEAGLPALPPSEGHRDVGELTAAFAAHYERKPSVHARLYPGVPAMLDTLAQGGIRTAVLTNKRGAVARLLLSELLPGNPLRDIVGDGAGFPRKPDPAAVKELIARAGTRPARTAVVG